MGVSQDMALYSWRREFRAGRHVCVSPVLAQTELFSGCAEREADACSAGEVCKMLKEGLDSEERGLPKTTIGDEQLLKPCNISDLKIWIMTSSVSNRIRIR